MFPSVYLYYGTCRMQPTDTKSGEITFCVTNVSRNGYTYDKTANVRNCAKVDH